MKWYVLSKYLYITIISLFILPLTVFAGPGCCSHHGGQDYCGNNGRWICYDGWESSCSCYNYETSDNDYNDNFTNDSYHSEDENKFTFADLIIILICYGPIALYIIYPIVCIIKDKIKDKR